MSEDVRTLTKDRPQETLPVALLLILAAGMLDAYTYVAHGGVFANAMTGNLVIMTVRLAQGQWMKALPYLAPIAAYIAGVALAHAVKQKPLRDLIHYPARFSLGLEVVFLVVVAFLPKSVPDMAVVVGIAFVAAVQGTSFTRIGKFAFTSVTTSANLRHFTESAMAALVFGEGKHAHREMRYFAAICSCFFVGAVLGAQATYRLGDIAVWLPITALSAALVLCLPWNKPLHRLMGLN